MTFSFNLLVAEGNYDCPVSYVCINVYEMMDQFVTFLTFISFECNNFACNVRNSLDE